ncbi:MAG TPA: GNAT family N-acetyltransferase [Symbiobacteriaceae bacterium]|nr:GNAT family N-acetyltransferase [Symbiobacteriaceae bacterium]
MRLPVVTSELVHRFEHVWAAFWTAHLTGIRRQPGNPLGVDVERFGGAIALRARGAAGDPWLNRILCLQEEDSGQLPLLLAFYREQGLTAHLEVCPGLTGPGLLGALAAQGCRQTEFHSVTYGLPSAELTAVPGVDVFAEPEPELFLRTLLTGFGAPEAEPLDGMRHWCEAPGFRRYLACVEGQPAGAAVLYIRDGIGYMANASTRPDMRGRGCQTALLRQRIADAAALGCELVMGMAAFGSTSQHNMERAGLRLAYTKSTYRG